MQNKKLYGFSLIELSVVILIVSIFASVAVNILGKKDVADKYDVTQKRLQFIAEALKVYKSANGHLPCPASSTILLDNANFGTGIPVLPNSCSSADNTYSSGNIVISSGAVPVISLGIPPEYMFDAWGNKFTYSVNTVMTIPTGYAAATSSNLATGTPTAPTINIRVEDSGNNSLLTRAPSAAEYNAYNGPPANTAYRVRDCFATQAPSFYNVVINDCAAFLVLSHGANGYRSYNPRGVYKTSTFGAGGTYEVSNSNNDNIFYDVPRNTDAKVNTTTSYFDDVLIYKTKDWLDCTEGTNC